MLDFWDPWWAVAIVLLLGLLAAEVAIPVVALRPWLELAGQYAQTVGEDPEPAPSPPPLSPIWPILVMVGAAVLAGLAIARRAKDPARHSRWLWMLFAAASCGGVGFVLLRLVIKLAVAGGEAAGGSPF